MRPWAAFLLAALAMALPPATARAEFGFEAGLAGLDGAFEEQDGSPDTAPGTHPYAMRVHVGFNATGGLADGDLRDLHLTLPPSMLANPAALAPGAPAAPGTPVECSAAQFHTPRVSPFGESLSGESCPDKSQLGTVAVHTGLGSGQTRSFGLFNLTAPYGASEAIGFAPFGVPIELSAQVREPDAAFVFGAENLPQAFDLQGLDLTLWGMPWDIAHDNERGNCLNEEDPEAPFGEPGVIVPGSPPSFHAGTCSVANPLLEAPKSYLSLPTVCGRPVLWEASARSWQGGATTQASAAGPPLAGDACIEPLTRAKVQLRTANAAAATGLLFNLDVNDGGGLLNSGGIVRSQIRKMTVSLPEGLTINPSLGSGLGVCGEADFARESASTPPGAGCPNGSKIGEVSAEGLLGLSEPLGGSVYLAKPYENRFGALLAVYVVTSSARRGIFVKTVGKVEPDPHSGRLTATFEDLPQLHYTHFSFGLREGQRSALVSPPTCGTYRADIEMTPWSDPALHVPDFSNFLITKGEGGGACPTGGLRPFAPKLEGGSLNTQAGAFTPFLLHMTRADAEQELTAYSASFPPGFLGKVAGIPPCGEAAIEAAEQTSGTAQRTHPSCPATSLIGHTLAGYGVGGTLAWAPGDLYLAGPYHGSDFSVVAIDSALVGPFDLGTVVVRSAVRIDAARAQVSLDSAASDPIPHILAGIPLHLRDIRVYVDRPGFTFNPTSCERLSFSSLLGGSGLDPFAPGDDTAATSSSRYQAANCSALGFAPGFGLRLVGSPKLGGHPSLRASVEPRAGEANFRSATVTLPPSLFLAQDRFGTVCTQAQARANACPARSVYGHARVVTPLLERPLEGPVYLRSSEHKLPDLVIGLHGNGIDLELPGQIDSRHGGIRARYEDLPDAPFSRFELAMRGGRKGILVNSEDLCAPPRRASARFIAQDNATLSLRPRLRAKCGKGKGGKRR
jgi:hypothetical protein